MVSLKSFKLIIDNEPDEHNHEPHKLLQKQRQEVVTLAVRQHQGDHLEPQDSRGQAAQARIPREQYTKRFKEDEQQLNEQRRRRQQQQRQIDFNQQESSEVGRSSREHKFAAKLSSKTHNSKGSQRTPSAAAAADSRQANNNNSSSLIDNNTNRFENEQGDNSNNLPTASTLPNPSRTAQNPNNSGDKLMSRSSQADSQTATGIKMGTSSMAAQGAGEGAHADDQRQLTTEVAITLPPPQASETSRSPLVAQAAPVERTNIDRQQAQTEQQQSLMTNKPPTSTSSSSPSSSPSISIVVVRHNDQQNNRPTLGATKETVDDADTDFSDARGADEAELSSMAHSQSMNSNDELRQDSGNGGDQVGSSGNSQAGGDSLPPVMVGGGGHDDPAAAQRGELGQPTGGPIYTTANGNGKQNNLLAFPTVHNLRSVGNGRSPPSVPPSDTEESRLSVTTESEHFEIVWSNLSYRIEPKWYKKFNYVDRLFSLFAPSSTIDSHSSATSTASSSANMNDDQHQMHAGGGVNSSSSSSSSSSTTSSSATESQLGGASSDSGATQKSGLEPIEIFTNLNGTIRSGQMTAVLGPSGAGKTTLLNCLTGKLRNGVSGHINLKGANGKHLKMCTIPQKDHLLEQLTVEENLWFASKIKNPEYGFDHAKNIERVIDLLGLKRCRSAKIKKISGGQHKRVSIAQELLSNPDILVLDEPTSGLDSLTCFKTISMLRDLVELSANNDFMKPMAIIVTIHQPQPKVFNLFHHVYILANGGRVIYEGTPENSLETITNVTCLQPIDSSKSTSLTPGALDPASFLIEIASEEYGVDVINTLSDYQRNAFYEANDSREAKRHKEHVAKQRCNYSSARNSKKSSFIKSSAKIIIGQENHGFTPDHLDHNQKSGATFTNGHYFYGDTTTATNNEGVNLGHLDSSKLEISCHDNTADETFAAGDGRKCKRRKRSAYSLDKHQQQQQQQQPLKSSHHKINFNSSDQNLYLSEQLLYTRVPNHKGRFWSHTATLTHRTLLTIRRDPLLMTSRVLFHLMIPILMGHVYGKATGAANACPHYEPEIDITQIPSLVENKRIEFMLEELHMSIENVSMFFIIMYAFAAAVLALNALSFPLNMQVLLKETRNGWYSMSSYVLAKTLADLPLELTMPCMTMLLVYPLTGQPSSYLQWRMLTICLIMTLCSLIAQTQALILGALVMNSVQTAVFVSQASQLPWVILAGFTIRIKRLSEPLKLISLTSFYRLGCEAITLTRYGFGICPCDPQEITGEPVRLVGIPDQLRTVAQYWLDSIEASKANNDTSTEALGEGETETTTLSSLITTTTTTSTTMMPSSAGTGQKTDIFQHLANQLSYANSYGVNITSCDDVAPDRIRAINLGDNWLVARIWHLFIMLIIMKIILYYAVRFSIGIRL